MQVTRCPIPPKPRATPAKNPRHPRRDSCVPGVRYSVQAGQAIRAAVLYLLEKPSLMQRYNFIPKISNPPRFGGSLRPGTDRRTDAQSFRPSSGGSRIIPSGRRDISGKERPSTNRTPGLLCAADSEERTDCPVMLVTAYSRQGSSKLPNSSYPLFQSPFKASGARPFGSTVSSRALYPWKETGMKRYSYAPSSR